MTDRSAATLIAAEHARRNAIQNGNFDALDAMTADHFHYAHVNGLVENRDAYFTRLRNDPGTKIFSTSASDLAVTLRDGYALLSGQSMIDSVPGTFNTLFLAVWEYDAAGWKISAYASTPLPQSD